MKRILTLVLLTALCLGCMSMTAWAGEDDYTADTWANAELKGLIYQDGEYINSDVAENYEAWWWEGEIPEMDDYFMASYINMRGFSMSADGRYAYMGALNGGTGVRGLVVLDMQVVASPICTTPTTRSIPCPALPSLMQRVLQQMTAATFT